MVSRIVGVSGYRNFFRVKACIGFTADSRRYAHMMYIHIYIYLQYVTLKPILADIPTFTYLNCLYTLKLADQPAPYFDNCKGPFLVRTTVATPMKHDLGLNPKMVHNILLRWVYSNQLLQRLYKLVVWVCVLAFWDPLMKGIVALGYR